MVAGNISAPVVLSKTQVLIQRGLGMTVPMLANKYGLSTQQMKMALQDLGLMKVEPEEQTGELTTREQKFLDVCVAHNIEADEVYAILADLGLEYKSGRRSTAGGKKYTIINDYQNEA